MANPSPAGPAAVPRRSSRIATIDWMRGLVMVLMTVDHASMAFDRDHLSKDSAQYPDAAAMALPAAEFFTRWITHLCAPTFVFLAGTALALSIERRVARGVAAWEIDRAILIRGAIIAAIDLTLVSLGSARWNFGVLFAIGVSMMAMAALRRLSTRGLVAVAGGWMVAGEAVTGLVWHPPGGAMPAAALTVATGGAGDVSIKYSVVPWLAAMMLGWVFGRHLVRYAAGETKVSGLEVLWVSGFGLLGLFVLVRGVNGYGNMFLPRADGSWQQWLHVSKYPPSLTYYALELGILFVCLWFLALIEPKIGVRPNGPFLVFGQTAMFFYLVHRLVLEVPATYFGLRGAGDLTTTYIVAFGLLLLLYPACRWYRALKAAHPKSLLKYL
jgi:uncharacterized membrane protein